MSQIRPAFLKLTVSTEWDSYDLQMNPGDSFTIGRSPDCKIPVPRPSVSQEHLRVIWNGWELQIEDLKSANGTFRLPQESPFVSASFAQKQDSLELKLSKSQVSFSWRVVSDLNADEPILGETSTEIAPREDLRELTGLKLKPHTQISSSPELARSLKQSEEERAAKNHEDGAPIIPAEELRDKTQTYVTQAAAPQPKKKEKKISKFKQESNAKADEKKSPPQISEKSLDAAAWCVAIIPATLLLAVSYSIGKNLLGGIATAPAFQLELGGIHDAVLILVASYRHLGMRLVLAPLATLVLSLLTRQLLLKNKARGIMPLASMFERDKFWGTRKYKVWIVLCAALTVTWPLLWSLHYGFNLSKLARYNEFLNVTRVAEQNSPTQNILELKKFTDVLPGSSLLYKHLFLNQRARILAECGGVGEKAGWPAKKNCLILLEAAAIEVYQDVKPALLNDVAQRVAILLSLDGLVRTLSVEGRGSDSLKFFLSSLDEIGLASEKIDIEKIISGREFDDDQAISLLRDLRRRIELRLDVRQLELGYPNALYIRVPGPLESGI